MVCYKQPAVATPTQQTTLQVSTFGVSVQCSCVPGMSEDSWGSALLFATMQRHANQSSSSMQVQMTSSSQLGLMFVCCLQL
jgi:hypothetical protein